MFVRPFGDLGFITPVLHLMFSVFLLLILIGLAFVVVRFLLVATRAAQIYIAKNTTETSRTAHPFAPASHGGPAAPRAHDGSAVPGPHGGPAASAPAGAPGPVSAAPAESEPAHAPEPAAQSEAPAPKLAPRPKAKPQTKPVGRKPASPRKTPPTSSGSAATPPAEPGSPAS